MEKPQVIRDTRSTDGIDFDKLKTVIRTNILWIILIFITINAIALLFVRYLQEIYQSESELKLEVKNEGTELGLKMFTEDPSINLISGEIEIIQSRLFLNRIVDSLHIDVSYISRGEVLDFELFRNSPFKVSYNISNSAYYEMPFDFIPGETGGFTLRFENGQEAKGNYGKLLSLNGLDLVITKSDAEFERNIDYVFIIHSRESAIDYLLSSLSVELLDLNANTIRVSFTDNNRYKAQALVNKIDSLYLNYSNQMKNLANNQKIDWLNNELEKIDEKMGDYEQYFENFTLQNRTNNLDEDLRSTVQMINKIDSQRLNISQRITTVSKLREDLLAGNLNTLYSSRSEFPAFLSEHVDELQVLTADLQRLKMLYKENTVALQNKIAQTEAARKNLLSETDEILRVLTREQSNLNSSRAKLETEFSGLPDKNTQFHKNQRYYEIQEELYLNLMQAKSGFEITQAGSTPDYKILSPATLPQKPISASPSIIAAIGVVASVVLNFLFVGLLYLANNKITSLSELERSLSVPALGIIPSSKRINSDELHVLHSPRSMVSEAFRTLRTNLDFFSTTNTNKVITITSTVSGEGKSFIAMNLGGIIAIGKKRVVLLDLDMRKKTSHAAFDSDKGISTILIKKHTWEDAIQKSSIEGLDVLPSGPLPPNPSELMMGPAFGSLLEELKKHYEFILLDTPPVGVVTDGIMAMRHADLTIYIFRANYSRKEFLETLNRLITVNKFDKITVLLNALRPSAERTYGYGYYQESQEKPTGWKSVFKRG